MVRPRSASSEMEEPSEETLLEQELGRLQRSYRVMQNDYRAYKEGTRKKIQKQKMLIGALEDERKELETELTKMQTTQNKQKDAFNTEKLEDLAITEKQIVDEIQAEREKMEDISAQVADVEKKIGAQRQKIGGIHTGSAKTMAAQKKKCVLENRLDKAMVHFNKQLAKNHELRDDIDHLRRERSVFENLYKKLATRLENCKMEMHEVIETTQQAFEQRDEAINKMTAMRERSDKDKQQHAVEMADLQRTIDHDEKVKEFMGVKNSERLELKAEEAAKKNRHGADRGAHADRETIRVYTEAFDTIKEVTGETDIEVIVDTFIKKEKENFALFNYVNELNCDVEKLQDEISSIQDEMEKFKSEDKEIDMGRSSLIKNLEKQHVSVSADAREAETNLTRVNKILHELKSDLQRMFNTLDCNPRPIKEMLGGDSGISNKNVMIYMGQIEQRASQLINMLHFAKLKKSEKLGLPPAVEPGAKTTTTPDYHSQIVPPSSWDDRDYEHDEDEQEEPLTEAELRARVMRAMRHHAHVPHGSTGPGSVSGGGQDGGAGTSSSGGAGSVGGAAMPKAEKRKLGKKR